MNIYQRIILILGAGSLVLVLLTAPKYVVLEGIKIDYSTVLIRLEYAKINPPRTYQDAQAIAKLSIVSPSIDVPQTCLRVAIVVFVTVLLCFAFNKLNSPHVKIPSIRISIPIVRFFKWISYCFIRFSCFLKNRSVNRDVDILGVLLSSFLIFLGIIVVMAIIYPIILLVTGYDYDLSELVLLIVYLIILVLMYRYIAVLTKALNIKPWRCYLLTLVVSPLVVISALLYLRRQKVRQEKISNGDEES